MRAGDARATSAQVGIVEAPQQVQSASRQPFQSFLAALRGWLARPRAQLALCLALAVAVRVYILAGAHGMLEGDEAVFGVQAEQILRGAHPIYFAGQPYMGSWEAYLAAPLIALLGPTTTALYTVTLLESLVLVPLLGALATRLYGARAALPAMLFAALPPLYVGAAELRIWGGYDETLTLGAGLLLVATFIAERWAQHRPTWRLWALFGLLAGFALWIDLLIIYYIATLALWLTPLALMRGWRLWRNRAEVARTARGAVACLVATLAGAAPAILYAFKTHGANIQFGGASFSHPVSRELRLRVVNYFFTYAARQVIGGGTPWVPLGRFATLIKLIGLAGALLALLYVIALPLWPRARTPQPAQGAFAPEGGSEGASGRVSALMRRRWGYALAPLLALCITGIFCFSNNPIPTVLNGPLDSSGRYALPLTTVLTLALAALVADLPALARWSLARLGAVRPARGGASGAPLAPSRSSSRRSSRRSSRLASLGASLVALVFVVALLGAYLGSYTHADLEATMQTSYVATQRFPAQQRELLTYLEREQIHAVWTSHWIGNLVVYFTDGRTQAADYVDVVVWHGPNRLPDALAAVASADRPSFIARATTPGQPPHTLTALDHLGVTYKAAQFGNLWVITPLSRTVRPTDMLLEVMQDY